MQQERGDRDAQQVDGEDREPDDGADEEAEEHEVEKADDQRRREHREDGEAVGLDGADHLVPCQRGAREKLRADVHDLVDRVDVKRGFHAAGSLLHFVQERHASVEAGKFGGGVCRDLVGRRAGGVGDEVEKLFGLEKGTGSRLVPLSLSMSRYVMFVGHLGKARRVCYLGRIWVEDGRAIGEVTIDGGIAGARALGDMVVATTHAACPAEQVIPIQEPVWVTLAGSPDPFECDVVVCSPGDDEYEQHEQVPAFSLPQCTDPEFLTDQGFLQVVSVHLMPFDAGFKIPHHDGRLQPAVNLL